MRRSRNQVQRGQLYAVEWVEWLVDCAVDGCEDYQEVLQIGREVLTAAEAEKRTKKLVDSGWRKLKARWHCPTHATGDAR